MFSWVFLASKWSSTSVTKVIYVVNQAYLSKQRENILCFGLRRQFGKPYSLDLRLSWSIVSPVLVYTNIHKFRIMYVLNNAGKPAEN